MKLKNVDDVRKVNAETFQLEDYHKHESREKIVANLYSKHLNWVSTSYYCLFTSSQEW
mgnify:CR=1 FL=1